MFFSIPLVSNLFVQNFFLRIFRNFRKGTVTVVLLFIAITFLVKQTERHHPAKEFRGYLLYIAPKLENIGKLFSSFSPVQSSLIWAGDNKSWTQCINKVLLTKPFFPHWFCKSFSPYRSSTQMAWHCSLKLYVPSLYFMKGAWHKREAGFLWIF